MIYEGVAIMETSVFEKMRDGVEVKNHAAVKKILDGAKITKYRWNLGRSENGVVRLDWRGLNFDVCDSVRALLDTLRHFAYNGNHGYAIAYLSEDGEDKLTENSGGEFENVLWLKTSSRIVCELAENHNVEDTEIVEGGIIIEELTNGRFVVRMPFGKKAANVDSRRKAKEIAEDIREYMKKCETGANEYIVTAEITNTVQKKIKADSFADATHKVARGYADFFDWGSEGEFISHPNIINIAETKQQNPTH